jgi:dihydrofolate reductase
MISLIAVIGKNRELGKDKQLLWHIPGDLPRFKQITMGHPIIMGRKTYESFGHPLPGRTNILVTRDLSFAVPGLQVVHSLDEALMLAKASEGGEEIFVIGGGEIYKQIIDRADRLYLTLVDREAEADTFFPEYAEFDKVVSQERQHVGGYSITYLTLEKSQN